MVLPLPRMLHLLGDSILWQDRWQDIILLRGKLLLPHPVDAQTMHHHHHPTVQDQSQVHLLSLRNSNNTVE